MDESRGYGPTEAEGPRGQQAPGVYSLETIMNLQKLLADGIPDEPAECDRPADHEVAMRLLSISSPLCRGGCEDNNSDLSTLVTATHGTVRNVRYFLRHIVRRLFAVTLRMGTTARHGRSMRRSV